MDYLRLSKQEHQERYDDAIQTLGETAREVTRLKAEVARLVALIDDTGKPWLALEPPVEARWEGGIDAAMGAAVEEIKTLRAKLATAGRDALMEAAEDCPSAAGERWLRERAGGEP